MTIGPAAADVRRVVGPTAWCALELLVATRADESEPWIVHSSVRDVATRLGVAPNTAQRALAVLRNVGLVEPTQRRGTAGRFDHSSYRILVAADVLTVFPIDPSTIHPARTLQDLRRAIKPRQVPVKVEQLQLLPQD